MHTNFKEAGVQLYDTFGEDSVCECSAFTHICVFSKCVFGKLETLAVLFRRVIQRRDNPFDKITLHETTLRRGEGTVTATHSQSEPDLSNDTNKKK